MQLWIVNTVVFHLVKINLLRILDLLIFFHLLVAKGPYFLLKKASFLIDVGNEYIFSKKLILKLPIGPHFQVSWS